MASRLPSQAELKALHDEYVAFGGKNPYLFARETGRPGSTVVRWLGQYKPQGEPKAVSQSVAISHCVIPDCQVKPGVPLEHLKWAGQYIADKRPDVIVCIGDFGDMPSLSSYDKGKRAAENRRYKADGSRQRGLVAGSFYQHDESYKGPQGNSHWQGIIMKNEVRDGNYDICEVSLDYLRRRYAA